jgi:hypothetical protein
MNKPLDIIGFADSALTFKSLADFKVRSFFGNKTSEVKRAKNSKIIEKDSKLFVRADTILGRDASSLLKGLLYLARGVDPDNWPGFAKYSRARDLLVEDYAVARRKREDEFRTVDQLDSIAQHEDRWAERLIALAEDSRGRGKIIDEFIALLDSSLARAPKIPASAYNFSLPTDYGRIAIGDTAANKYEGDFFIIIDRRNDLTICGMRGSAADLYHRSFRPRHVCDTAGSGQPLLFRRQHDNRFRGQRLLHRRVVFPGGRAFRDRSALGQGRQ